MAETSGFATDLPQSAYLAHTIRRAISAAQQRSHRYVTLEHLLLALLDDADALALLEVARTDVAALRVATVETVNHSLATLYTPGAFDLRASYKVERVLQSASDDARRMGCAEVDGAFVAVALFHETDSPAYELLKRHNFVFHAANGWITRNRGSRAAYAPPPASPAPPPPPAPVETPAPEQEASYEQTGYDSRDEEPEEEILLDELVVEEEEDDEDAPAQATGSEPEPEAVLPPYLRERPVTKGAEPAYPAARPAPREEAEPEARPQQPAPRPAPPPPPQRPAPPPQPAAKAQPRPEMAPPRPEPAPPRAEPAPPRQEPPARPVAAGPDLGSAVPARELPPPPSQGGAVPMGRSAPDRARIEPRSTSLENARSEPRLPVPPAPRGGGGSSAPGRTLSGRLEGPSVEPRFDPPASSSEGLGSAVPARDFPAPGHAETAEAPSRPQAPIRERSRMTTPNGAHAPGGREQPRSAPGAPPPPPPRAEPALPPANRLDDMRVRPGPASPPVPPAPSPTPAPAARGTAKKAARDKESEKTRRRRPPSPGAVYAGKLAENIPRKMRAFKTETIEVRITRQETESVLSGMEGSSAGGEPVRHDLLVTQAMSVVLRAPDGGFVIETLGPETQWIFNDPSFAEKEPFGRWRWSVTPNETGKRRLQLVVAARSVDQNGLAGDTAMPDQVISVRVRANYGRSIAQIFRWLLLLVLGGAITEGAQMVMRLLSKAS